jgi:hypothetical protein
MTIDRNLVSFSQAEGLKSLPSQLRLGELSPELRNELWSIIYGDLRSDIVNHSSGNYFREAWKDIIEQLFVEFHNFPLDQFENNTSKWIKILKIGFIDLKYNEVFDLISFLIRCRNFKAEITDRLGKAFIKHKAAYRIYEHHIIAISNEIDAKIVTEFLNSNILDDYHGAKAHLLQAGQYLASGKFSESIRESIHSVESVCRKISNENTFKDALNKIKKRHKIHPSLESGFNKIYSYTSDEKGIRHALIEEPEANVDETDALFMFSACAAFVSYLINKSLP